MKLSCFCTIMAVLIVVQCKSVKQQNTARAKNSIRNEALDELEQLKEIASEEKNRAKTKIYTKQSELVNHKNNIQANGEERMHSKYLTLTATLDTIKDLANNYDIDTCLISNEPALAALPSTILIELNSCTSEVISKSNGINNETLQSIEENTDIIVKNLENDVIACRTVLCLMSAVRQIQNNVIFLTQNIQTEVDQATELVNVAGLSVDQCLESKVASFVSQGMEIIDKVSKCVDGLMVY